MRAPGLRLARRANRLYYHAATGPGIAAHPAHEEMRHEARRDRGDSYHRPFVLWEVLRGGPSFEGVYLGYVEGDLLYIGPIEGERLGSLSVDAGSQVETGAPLFSMETPLLDAQHNEAAARIAQMDANLENLKAALNRPQQVAVLEAAVDRAEAELKLSQLTFDRQQKLYAARDVSKATLDNAQMALSRDTAALAEAKRQVDAALLTGRSQEIDAAEASLRQARAQLHQLDIRISRQKVFAPAAGVVQDVFFRVGEMVNAGQPVLSLAAGKPQGAVLRATGPARADQIGRTGESLLRWLRRRSSCARFFISVTRNIRRR